MCCEICKVLFLADLHHRANHLCFSHSKAYVRSSSHNTVSILLPLRIKACLVKLLCYTEALSTVHLHYADGTHVRQ
jgi:hypothetical protein